MKFTRTIRQLLHLIALVALVTFTSCAKEEVITPCDRSQTELRGVFETSGTGPAEFTNVQRIPGHGNVDLRDGDGDDGGGEGGISDDGDDEADNERGKKP